MNKTIIRPSGFDALLDCVSKLAMEKRYTEQSSKSNNTQYSAEGTAAHFLAATILNDDTVKLDALKTYPDIKVTEAGDCFFENEKVATGKHYTFKSNDLIEPVLTYVRLVKETAGKNAMLFIEQEVPIDHITGEVGATGTADAIVIKDKSITIIDLKFGMGVEVEATTAQLKFYAMGAAIKFAFAGDFEEVRCVISQPRLNDKPSIASYKMTELIDWVENEARPLSRKAYDLYLTPGNHQVDLYANPSEKACKFCRAKAHCPSLAAVAKEAIEAEFTDLNFENEAKEVAFVDDKIKSYTLEDLAIKFKAVRVLELFTKAIQTEALRRRLAGEKIVGAKLIRSRKGNKTWEDEDTAEAELKAMRLKSKDMYKWSLISPTAAVKLLEKTPKRLERIIPLITQTEGALKLVPLSDKGIEVEIDVTQDELKAIEVE